MIYIYIVLGFSFALSFLGSRLSILLANKLNIVDDPKFEPTRKKQKTPIPLLGASGFIIIATIFSLLTWLTYIFDWFGVGSSLYTNLEGVNFGWILVSVIILLIGGFIDDKYRLKAKWLAIPITIALLITIFLGGLQIEALSYPFDSFLPQNQFLPPLLSFLWLGLCVSATKFLDGHDGLVTSMGFVTFLVIASVSLFDNVFQPFTAILSLIWAFSLLGFLPFNFPEAKSYLGEGGSEIVGFMIGVLSILSGAKVATSSMVIGWFIIDIIFVILLRIYQKKNPLKGDRLHWHFRLLDMGMSKIQVLVLTTILILITAHAGLIFPTNWKLWVIISQIFFLVIVFTISIVQTKSKKLTTQVR